MNFKIRELQLLDLFRIRELSEVYLNAFGSPTYSISRFRILYYLIQKRNNFFIIAEIKKKIVGVAYAHTYPMNDLVYLDFIAVKKSYQRKGIGSALLKVILKKAIDAKKKKIFFIIRSDNENGIRFYQKHGFMKEKEYYGYSLNLC